MALYTTQYEETVNRLAFVSSISKEGVSLGLRKTVDLSRMCEIWGTSIRTATIEQRAHLRVQCHAMGGNPGPAPTSLRRSPALTLGEVGQVLEGLH